MSTKSVSDLINERAYYIYEARIRTGAPGDEFSDRAQAEKEVMAEMKKKSAAAPETAAKKKPGRKPGRKPADPVAAAAAEPVVKERKKPGRKPKALLEAQGAVAAPVKKKRGPAKKSSAPAKKRDAKKV